MTETEVVTMPELGRVLYTTANYEIQICSIVDPETKGDLVVYGILNRDTGVREAELRGYPHAVKWADNLQAAVNDLYKQRAEADAIQAALEDVDEGTEAEEEVVDAPTPISREDAKAALASLGTDEAPTD